MRAEGSGQQVSAARAMQAMRANRPLRAEEICRDYLLMNPGCVEHLRLLGHALMKQNRLDEAERELRRALSGRPDFPQLYEDLGSVFAMRRDFEGAVGLFREAIAREPRLPLAHRKLGQALAALGRGEEADEHFEEFLDKDPESARIAGAVECLGAGRLEESIAQLRAVLKDNPDRVDAMRYLAMAHAREEQTLARIRHQLPAADADALALRGRAPSSRFDVLSSTSASSSGPRDQAGRRLDALTTKVGDGCGLGDAEAWLRRATELAPDFTAAWLDLGLVLAELNKHMEAIECYRSALRGDPEHAGLWAGLANALALASYPERSIDAFEKSLSLDPDAPGVQMSYAHSLKTLGRQDRAVQAYRAAIRLKPDFGEVYWSLANLKAFRFEAGEVAAMRGLLDRNGLDASAEIHCRFALAKALEDEGDYDGAWRHYDSGNRKHRMRVSHDPAGMEKRHEQIVAAFTEGFLAEQSGNGLDAADPILIVGLPRSGSTLVEQILASHSQVEGTSELPILNNLANSIGRYRPEGVLFPESALQLSGRDWAAYGQQYLGDARRHRATGRPYFTDKLPNNFPFIGLLHLILPNARVINARRHPLDACLGCYRQLFARGQNFTYDLEELAHYYQCYDRMMAHWHAVLPGKVLDVHYEDTVCDTEAQVRRILDHCGLPFEESCLRFHENPRAVKTASSEQVRQPIYRGALGMWRNYERHLTLWADALGGVIAKLPASVRDAAE